MRGVFVTGTDTGVGKTIVSAALCAALVARGERVAAFKPAVTGLDDPPGEWPHDHELLASLTGQSPHEVSPHRFGPPASPHLVGELAPADMVAQATAASQGADAMVVEGVGGLLVPLTLDYSIRDFALELRLPLLVAARPGLGTINHTLLTVEAARAVGLEVAAVVLTPWPERPDTVERSNRETIERLAGLPVEELPHASRDRLAGVGAHLTRHTPPR